MPKALLVLPGLAAMRAQSLLSQQELADRAGLHVMSVSELERGRAATPATVRKLAKALGVKPERLVEG